MPTIDYSKFIGIPEKKWNNVDTVRIYNPNIEPRVVRERLTNALYSEINLSNGFLGRSSQANGTITGDQIEITITIRGGRGSSMNYKVYGVISPGQNNTTKLELVIRDSQPIYYFFFPLVPIVFFNLRSTNGGSVVFSIVVGIFFLGGILAMFAMWRSSAVNATERLLREVLSGER